MKKIAKIITILFLSFLIWGCDRFSWFSMYKLNVESNLQDGNSSISITPEKEAYSHGEKVALTAIAPQGFRFMGWDQDAAGTETNIIITMDSDKNITVLFEAAGVENPHDSFTLNISFYPPGAGLIEIFPQKNTYTRGEVVELSVTPKSQYLFKEWDGDISGTEFKSSITMDSDKNISANFQLNTEYLGSWRSLDIGLFEESNEGLVVGGSTYRGSHHIVTKALYDLSDGEIFYKWKSVGTLFASHSVGVFGVFGGNFTSHHSFNGTILVAFNTWYFTRITLNSSDKSYRCVTATGNYDSNGGTFFNSQSGTVSEDKWTLIQYGQLSCGIGDAYGGTDHRMVVAEAYTDAAIVSLGGTGEKSVYSFNREGEGIPSVFTGGAEWSVEPGMGYINSPALYNNNAVTVLLLNVENAVGISFRIRTAIEDLYDPVYFSIGGVSMGHWRNNRPDLWKTLYYPIHHQGLVELQWTATDHQTYGTTGSPKEVWLDDVTVYY